MNLDAELKPFVIDDVHRPSDESQTLGSGSYGSVELFVIGTYGLKCAGKSLHSALVEPENEDVDQIKSKFVRECKVMSTLRHPNIVQFLGICFLPNSSDLPVLLMEYMTTNLNSLLETYKDISLSMKISILNDVALGLAYLHSHCPPIIHRDLTATNVLLDSALSAKITDFGNSRLVDISPDQLAKTMTCVPGTLVYLPPESLNPKPVYNEKLDSFSYGHLALYVITQVFPMPSAPTFLDPETNKVIGRTEVERREEFIQSMENGDGDFIAIKKLIINCLCNDPAERPSSQHILGIMQKLMENIGDPNANMLKLHLTSKDPSNKDLESTRCVMSVLMEVRSYYVVMGQIL